MKSPKQDDEQKKANFLAITLGTDLVGPIILGGLAGYWIDKSNNTHNKWTLILLGVGIIIGIYNFIKIVRKLNK